MARFPETRVVGVLLGLVMGLVVAAGSTPAHAVHIVLEPGESGIVGLGEPVHILGDFDREDVNGPGEFTHTFNFGFDIGDLPSGIGGASATPNLLEIGAPIAGLDEFEGVVMGPGLGPDGIALTRPTGDMAVIPRINRISANFAAMDTGGNTPYTLTIMGSLLEGVKLGNYTGNIGVTPLPGAALLFLSALGGLVVVRRYRQQDAAAA